jgi:hypothetical protein
MMTPQHHKNLVTTLFDMLRLEGPGSFYTGCAPAIVSMAIGGAVFYGTYDWLKTAWLLRAGRDPCVFLPLLF